MARTPTQQLLDHLLGEPVEDWVKVRRAAGRSWRVIARDIWDVTQGQVDVTGERLRRWLETPQPGEPDPPLSQPRAS